MYTTTAGLHRPRWMSSWQQRLGGRYNLTASLIAALVFAFAVAGLVGLAITRVIAPMPSEDEAMAIAQIATNKPPVNLPGGVVHCNRVCPMDWYLYGDQVASFDDDILDNLAPSIDMRGLPPGAHPLDDHVAVAYQVEFQNVETFLPAARQRLATAGWRVTAISDDPSYTSIWATKNDLVVRMYTTTAPYERGQTALIEVSPNFPAYGGAFIGLSFLLSLPAGWTLTTRTVRRARRTRTQIKALIVIAGSLVLPAICIALIGMSVAGIVAITHEQSITDLLLPAATLSVLSGIPVVIPATATAIASMLLLTALPLPRQNNGQPAEKASRRLTA